MLEQQHSVWFEPDLIRLTKKGGFYMYIWDEEIIDKLCDTHLKIMWRDVWKVYDIIEANRYTNSKLAREFVMAPLHLAHRMSIVYSQMLKRGLRVKKKPLTPFDITDIPITQLIKELKLYVPRMTTSAQIQYLKKLNCECKNNL